MTIVLVEGDAYSDAIVSLVSIAHPNYPLTVADHLEYKRFNEDMFRRE